MERNETISRKCVLRAYGVVSLLQLCLGLFLIISGLLALKYSEEFHVSRPPYFLGAFLVGILVISAGICTLYIYMTEAPMIDYYFLEDSAVKRIRQSVTCNTILSTLALLGCLLGLFVCVVFAIGPCDNNVWLSKCSFHTNKTENKIIAIFITVFLSSLTIVSMYSALMSCVHGWVFDFDVITVKIRQRRLDSSDEAEIERPLSGFQQVGMFDIEEHINPETDDDEIHEKYNATSSFKQMNEHNKRHSNEHKRYSNEHKRYSNEYGDVKSHPARRQQQPPSSQTPNYIAVLNDPAMKQKLKERNNLLQEN